MPRSPTRSTKSGSSPTPAKNREEVPSQSVEILKEGLGVDLSIAPPDEVRAMVQLFRASMSVSSSPYTSGNMLKEYVDAGLPHVAEKAIVSIDQQRDHRQKLEELVTRRSEDRKDKGQLGAQVIAVLGVVGALVAAYFGVSSWVCFVVVIVAIGGPNAATIAARFIDKAHKG